MTDRNSVVWAKIKFCSFWPARLVEPPKEIQKQSSRKLCVLFFGTNNYGFVDAENIKSYLPNETKYEKKGRGKIFHDAVRECKNFMKDPQNFCSVVSSHLIVKQECNFVIKNEIDNDAAFLYDRQTVKRLEALECVTCRKHVSEIVELKSENEKMCSDLISSNKNIYRLNIEAKEKEIEHRKLNEEKSNQIQFLQNQLNELRAKVNNEHEVEKLLKHRNYRNNNRKFLVRWANYDSSHDSWVCERNISPDAVKEYFENVK